MSERYYCSKDPTHDEFHAPAVVSEWWVVDEQGNWLDTLDGGDVINGPDMDEANCAVRGCGGKVVYGIPPSPLKQLAEQAE